MSPAAWSSLLPRGRPEQGEIRREKLLKASPSTVVWTPPPQCPNKGRASSAIYGGVGDITRQRSGAVLAQLSPFFIVRWWHVRNVMANSLWSRAPPSFPLWPWVSAAAAAAAGAAAAAAAWLLLSLKKKQKKTVRYGSTCPASQLVGKLSGGVWREDVLSWTVGLAFLFKLKGHLLCSAETWSCCWSVWWDWAWPTCRRNCSRLSLTDSHRD